MAKLTLSVSNNGPAHVLEDIYESAKLHHVKVKRTEDHDHYHFTFTSINIYFFLCFLPHLEDLIFFLSNDDIELSLKEDYEEWIR